MPAAGILSGVECYILDEEEWPPLLEDVYISSLLDSSSSSYSEISDLTVPRVTLASLEG